MRVPYYEQFTISELIEKDIFAFFSFWNPLQILRLLCIPLFAFVIYAWELYTSPVSLIYFAVVAITTVVYVPPAIVKTLFPSLDPAGKCVLITGCDRGMGLHTAKHLTSIGMEVIAACLDLKSEGAVELSKTKNVHVMKLDITKKEEIEDCYKKVVKIVEGKGLWGLVNNAGVAYSFEFEVMHPTLHQRTIDINLVGTLNVTLKFLRLLRRTKGRLVFFSSMAGMFPMPLSATYSATKAAVAALAEAIREEQRKWEVKVSVVLPLFFATPMITDMKTFGLSFEKQIEPDILEDYGEDYFKMMHDRTWTSDMFFLNHDLNRISNTVINCLLDRFPPRQVGVGFGAWPLMAIGIPLFKEIAQWFVELSPHIYPLTWFKVKRLSVKS